MNPLFRQAAPDARGFRDITVATLKDNLAMAEMIDVREPQEFTGELGHIPGSRNLPYSELYNPDGTFKSREELRRLFVAAGADPEKPFVATCGSGVTANALIFAARLLGNRDTRLYDGSWSEWGADPSTPKEKGPA